MDKASFVQEPASRKRATRVLIVDDRPEICQFMTAMLESDTIEIVAFASDGLDALTKTMELRPDVVVMDLRMPRLDGATATRIIKGRFPEIRVFGLTNAEADHAWELNAAGADRVFMKSEFLGLADHLAATA